MASPEARNALERHLRNPFLLLEVAPDARREDIERQGAKLLALLAADLPGANSYPTPLGPRRRRAEDVREALAELRDPERRAGHEWWARGFGEAAT
jgi:hypothetical protein